MRETERETEGGQDQRVRNNRFQLSEEKKREDGCFAQIRCKQTVEAVGGKSGQLDGPAGSGQSGSCSCAVRVHSRALSQRFLPRCSDLPVAVNHLHHQPELQPDDGDVHHHLGQDGRLAPGHWVGRRDGEGETSWV